MIASTFREHKVPFVLCVALLVLGSVIPSLGTITHAGVVVLFGFVAVIIAWVGGLPAWFGLIVTFWYAAVRSLSFSTVFLGMMSSELVWTMIGIFWFLGALQKSGMVEFITAKILSNNIAKRGPYWLSALFMVSSIVVCALTQATGAVIALELVILYEVTVSLDLKPYNMWTVSTAVAMCCCCSLGTLIIPVNWVTLTYLMQFKSIFGLEVDPAYLPYTVFALCSVLIGAVVLLAVTKFIIRPEGISKEKLQNLKISSSYGTWKSSIGWSFLILVVMLIFMILPYVLPDEWAITTFLSNWGTFGAFFLASLLFCFVRDDSGKELFNFSDIVSKNTNWTFIMFMGPILYFGTQLNSDELGIMATLQSLCSPLAAMNPYVLMAVLTLLTWALTNATNNFIPCLLFVPIGMSVYGGASGMAQLFATFMILTAFNATALPPSSTVGLVLNSQTQMIQTKQCIQWGYIFTLIGWAVNMILALTVGQMFL